MKQLVLLSLGSNQGDSAALLRQSCRLIERNIGKILKQSALYTTSPVGFEAEQHFVNALVFAECDDSPHALLAKCHAIEAQLGRVRKVENREGHPYVSRSMDIDIVDYSGRVISDPPLFIPHQRMHERLFVLIPLKEVLPHWIHPLHKKSIAAMIGSISAPQSVVRNPQEETPPSLFLKKTTKHL